MRSRFEIHPLLIRQAVAKAFSKPAARAPAPPPAPAPPLDTSDLDQRIESALASVEAVQAAFKAITAEHSRLTAEAEALQEGLARAHEERLSMAATLRDAAREEREIAERHLARCRQLNEEAAKVGEEDVRQTRADAQAIQAAYQRAVAANRKGERTAAEKRLSRARKTLNRLMRARGAILTGEPAAKEQI